MNVMTFVGIFLVDLFCSSRGVLED